MDDNNNQFETASPESPCSKCGAVTDKNRLNCEDCGKSILHGQEHFDAGEDEGDTFCLCDSCDEFGPPSEEGIPFVRFGVEPTTECRDLHGKDQNERFAKPVPEVVARLSAVWKDGIDFERGWTALLARFSPSNTYVARLGDRVEMVAEFLDVAEAVRFTVHLENILGTKALLERRTIK